MTMHFNTFAFNNKAGNIKLQKNESEVEQSLDQHFQSSQFPYKQ